MRRGFIVKPVDANFSLKEHIYDVLNDGIMAMDIDADDARLKLEERQLSEQLQISRTPIREALACLEQEGLVWVIPRRGAFVLRESVDQIFEMITVWAAFQTCKLGCMVTTAGPGCTNAMTGVACAFRAETPMLHIGGRGALTQHKMGSLQDLPHVDMMAPITKFSAGVRSTERVADMISMAARESFAGAYLPDLALVFCMNGLRPR